MAGTVGTILKKKPESYKDVKGAVVSDYQQYLEKEWVKQLREKYKVEVYEDVLKTVNKKR
jgi:peptidyl-prolyl cis-trans isomerase SurA